ncbi:hypothetical protein DBR22_13515 [Arthrobacter sp. HMWF013]|nr:hypothetical protein DBR22_13515 [Arthrobacter sp. HMWF013]
MNPLWAQFEALIPPVIDTHPLGCHRPRVSDRVVFDKLVQVLVLGVMYEKIADTSSQNERCVRTGAKSAPRSVAPEDQLFYLLGFNAEVLCPFGHTSRVLAVAAGAVPGKPQGEPSRESFRLFVGGVVG